MVAGADSLRSGLEGVVALRDEDYRYALGLLNIPSLAAPDLGPSLFGEWAKQRAEPVLYWLGMAERYMPPGVRRQLIVLSLAGILPMAIVAMGVRASASSSGGSPSTAARRGSASPSTTR